MEADKFKKLIEDLFRFAPIDKNGAVPLNHPFKKHITNTIKTELPNYCPEINKFTFFSGYKTKYNDWVSVPNFGYAKNDDAPQNGVYIVYLLSKDSQRLYLALAQGCTVIKNNILANNNKGKNKTPSNKEQFDISNELRKNADQIEKNLGNQYNFNTGTKLALGDSDNPNLGTEFHVKPLNSKHNETNGIILPKGLENSDSKFYNSGAIFFKEYKRNNLPDGKILLEDLKNMVKIYEKYNNLEGNDSKDTINPAEPTTNTREKLSYPLNWIVYGAPGTGKSFKINTILENLSLNHERVTFHPDYSYANFVGTYKPVPDKADKKQISYKFVPGPFIRMYIEAKKDPAQNHILVIEEINRAMVAAVFGDVFQLLDRKSDGNSEYPIALTEDLKDYLSEIPEVENDETLAIPSNLYIWATMNSADQGVFPLDTAFKRRWDFEYLPIDFGEPDKDKMYVEIPTDHGMKKINWNDLRHKINELLIRNNINEDKLLGPYFLSINSIAEDGKKLSDENFSIDSKRFCDAFKTKVIMYLFEDAAKHIRTKIFGGCNSSSKTFSMICKKFDEIGDEIFSTL